VGKNAFERLSARIWRSVVRPDVEANAYNQVAGQALDAYRRTGSVDLWYRAALGFAEALRLLPTDHPHRPAYLSNLGQCYRARFEHSSGDDADLDEAIEVARRAVIATPTDHPDRPGVLMDLGASLADRYVHAGDGAALDEAIELVREAVNTTSEGHPDRSERMSFLGNCLLIRFEHAGRDADLDEALELGRQTVKEVSVATPRRGRVLMSHVSSLQAKFGRSPNDEALREAGRLATLANSLHANFKRAGEVADLDEAITASRRALEVAPASDPDCLGRLTNLGNYLHARYTHSGDVADLDEAIDLRRQALEATTAQKAITAAPLYRAMVLSNLGACLAARFDRSQDVADLDEAIDSGRQALKATPSNAPHRGWVMSNIASYLYSRYRYSEDVADLDAAIHVGRQALEATPAVDPHRARVVSNLADFLHAKYRRSEDVADLDAAITGWGRASRIATALPRDRLFAARAWAQTAMQDRRMPLAMEGYGAAMTLLPQVAWHGLGRPARERLLSRWSGLATETASCAIQVGDPERAVELLDQGRSVMWTQTLDLRSDLTAVAEQLPQLAKRLDQIRSILDAPSLDNLGADPLMAGLEGSWPDLARGS
jgi:tetratricopeptide (TPR) repeat protein